VSLGLKVAVESSAATGLLARLIDGLTDRTRLHQTLGTTLEKTTAAHLLAASRSRHKSARALGASPTGHLSRAAESVTHEADSDGVSIGITSPGITRAVRDLDIKPTGGRKYLTIPARKEAYGKRAGEIDGLSFFRSKKTGTAGLGITTGKGKERKLHVFYWLVKSVTVPQDRELIPSADQYRTAAAGAASTYVAALRSANQGAA
jgi:hypothetical protein